MTDRSSRTIAAREPAETPPLSLLFGFGAMLPLAAGAVAAWLMSGALAFLVLNLTLFWGSAILTFLAGVRRGLSFRTPNGPTSSQLATMLWIFGAGFAGLFATVWGFQFLAALMELAAFASLAILDPIAAKRGEAPLFFASLRPVQMLIPIVSLIVIAAFAYSGSGF